MSPDAVVRLYVFVAQSFEGGWSSVTLGELGWTPLADYNGDMTSSVGDIGTYAIYFMDVTAMIEPEAMNTAEPPPGCTDCIAASVDAASCYDSCSHVLAQGLPSGTYSMCGGPLEDEYEIQDWVVWSSFGHDIMDMMGTIPECQAACSAEVPGDGLIGGETGQPGHDLQCVGFSRTKGVADDAVSNCWLKAFTPEADRSYGNDVYWSYVRVGAAVPSVPVYCDNGTSCPRPSLCICVSLLLLTSR